MITILKRIFKQRTRRSSTRHSKGRGSAETAPIGQRAGESQSPEWRVVLTESLRRNSIAPSDEAVLHAFDLYGGDLYAPFHERRQEMATHYAQIAAGFNELQALIPDVIERAMARDPWEFFHIIDHEPEE
jgi:hypothetical protein